MKNKPLGITKLLAVLNESIEYSEKESKQDVPWPDFIKKLAAEVNLLDKKSQQAYEENDPAAPEIDALFAEKKEELENALADLEDDVQETDDEDKFASFGAEELMRQFATIYHHYVNKIPYQGHLIDKNELLSFLRAWAQDYGWALGGFKQETTDEHLLDAAKDSYKRMKRILHYGRGQKQ